MPGLNTIMKVLTPKTIPSLDPPQNPVFFFAGPGPGGGDWQTGAVLYLNSLINDCFVAIPHQYPDDHPLTQFAAKEVGRVFESQSHWERHLFEIASKSGCIMFWLPEESKIEPRPRDHGPYGLNTLSNLGRWSARKAYDPAIKLVIGAEPGFPGLDAIHTNTNMDVGYDFRFHATLEETVRAAVMEARGISTR